mmetsp:Transcript_25650/g.24558  ORF Transcript_25650/g.24558 Transcript_25650/m.24558 type:complete len:225 (-) Transcript_25650:168-842(-)|eukprot:CAMPEP_0197823966 /NCGR_PEP_ID=MMETSP1437-20131217/1281_1 /TAXON_ID=49252 ORGANISM="Eucampia antarctica, Strain CCMP1452" /NCGR_SAMPLE_ID=MMETSP1437 /ASSEMBLY_ACC=CAM_ASM_001096 /LENGTH=224 /DNA_ID=CAMNT_0043423405 /DNA_START=67 /DNA_END=741 /DNA_ORIENTATION=+
MSWKAGLSRHLPILRFFACAESPSSRGVLGWYTKNYEELNILNPNMPLFLRTTDNAMSAVTTELSFTTDDLLKFMIQTGRFRNGNGTIAEDRVEAAKAYLKTDWALIRKERWASPGFDPEHPLLDQTNPDWKSDSKLSTDLALYLDLKEGVDEQTRVIESGPSNEYTRSENSLLMCQRVDLWCAGEQEVEAAVKHLYKLGRRFNSLEVENPDFITEFYPGVADF